MQHALKVQQVTKSFPGSAERSRGGACVLEEINLEIAAGEFFVVVGPSGSGKSTLLRIMSGLEKAYKGSVAFSGGGARPRIGFVFQQFALFPWLTVYENVALALPPHAFSAQERARKVKKELVLLGLERVAAAYPRELSGGMRQRVGIARALVNDPEIIFMDEPFSELDSFTATGLRKELLGIWQERAPTIVMVTHIIKEAIELADRIAVLTPRPGRIEKIFINRLPRPRHERTEPFWRLEDELYEVLKP